MAKRKRQHSDAHLAMFTQAAGALDPHATSGYVARDVTNAPVRPTRQAAYLDWLDAHGMAD